MHRFILAGLVSAVLITATSADTIWANASAATPCAKGEVWGDVGCQPKAQPSPMARAAKKVKARFQKTKPAVAAPLPELPPPMRE